MASILDLTCLDLELHATMYHKSFSQMGLFRVLPNVMHIDHPPLRSSAWKLPHPQQTRGEIG